MWDSLLKLGNLGLAGWDAYQGYQSQQQANKYSNMLAGSVAMQSEWAQDLWDRMMELQWPIEDLQAEYALEDLEKLRKLQVAQRDYGITKGLGDIAQAKILDPILDQTKESLVKKLAEGEDVLADRMRATASTDIGASFGQQRDVDARRFAAAGINPNSGMFQNYMQQMGTSQALAEAGARTQASRQAEDTALSRQAQALNYRAGIPLSAQQFSSTTTPTAALSGLGAASGMLSNLANQQQANASDYFKGATYSGRNLLELMRG